MDVEFGWKYFLLSGHLEDQENMRRELAALNLTQNIPSPRGDSNLVLSDHELCVLTSSV